MSLGAHSFNISKLSMITIGILLINVTIHDTEMKENVNISTNAFLKSTTETLMSSIILISVTGHMAVAGIYDGLPLVSILYVLHPWHDPHQFLALFLEE